MSKSNRIMKKLFNASALIMLSLIFLGVFACGGGGGGGDNDDGGNGGSGVLTADAGGDQTVSEGDSVALNGAGSEGSIATYSWSQTGGNPTVTLNAANTATPTFTAPGVVADTVLTFTLTVTDGGGNSSSDEVSVTVQIYGVLSGSVDVSAGGSVNLTDGGLIDWAHWGLLTRDSFNQKAGITNQISNYTPIIFSGNPVRFDDSPVAFSWTDGTPNSPVTNTTTGIFFPMNNSDGSDLGKGYSLTVPADTTLRTLTLHLGGNDCEGRLIAELSDGSAGRFVATLARPNGPFTNVVMITYRALSDSTTLNIEYTLTDDFGTPSALTLNAAELDSVAKPKISPPGGAFTDSVEVTLTTATPVAEIRYTDNGTEPDASSTLYTGPFMVSSDKTIRVKAFRDGNESPESSANFTVRPTGGGSISAFVTQPPASVNLSTEGTLDWAHWGLLTRDSFNQKAGITNQISNYTRIIFSGNPVRFDDSPVAYSWTGGTPNSPVTNTTTGIFFPMNNSDGSDLGKGYSLTVAADNTPKTIKLYLGGGNGVGELVASLSDGSAEDAVLFISNEFGSFTRCVTIEFRAASGLQSLTIDYTLSDDFGSPSNLTLQAATLE